MFVVFVVGVVVVVVVAVVVVVFVVVVVIDVAVWFGRCCPPSPTLPTTSLSPAGRSYRYIYIYIYWRLGG